MSITDALKCYRDNSFRSPPIGEESQSGDHWHGICVRLSSALMATTGKCHQLSINWYQSQSLVSFGVV